MDEIADDTFMIYRCSGIDYAMLPYLAFRIDNGTRHDNRAASYFRRRRNYRRTMYGFCKFYIRVDGQDFLYNFSPGLVVTNTDYNTPPKDSQQNVSPEYCPHYQGFYCRL